MQNTEEVIQKLGPARAEQALRYAAHAVVYMSTGRHLAAGVLLRIFEGALSEAAAEVEAELAAEFARIEKEVGHENH